MHPEAAEEDDEDESATGKTVSGTYLEFTRRYYAARPSGVGLGVRRVVLAIEKGTTTRARSGLREKRGGACDSIAVYNYVRR